MLCRRLPLTIASLIDYEFEACDTKPFAWRNRPWDAGGCAPRASTLTNVGSLEGLHISSEELLHTSVSVWITMRRTHFIAVAIVCMGSACAATSQRDATCTQRQAGPRPAPGEGTPTYAAQPITAWVCRLPACIDCRAGCAAQGETCTRAALDSHQRTNCYDLKSDCLEACGDTSIGTQLRNRGETSCRVDD